MTDRQRMFDYLDGVADGLNESRNDVADVLEQIRDEIEQSWDGYLLTDNQSFEGVPSICINHALDIIDKYREDKE